MTIEPPLSTLRGKITLLLTLFLSSFNTSAQNTGITHYVNPFIGTGGHGHTFPGATTPFGMVQLSPDTRIDGSWDGCSGYHYSDTVIYGFSHTHLSGTGVSDHGDMHFMPVQKARSFLPEMYAASFSHANEQAEAGYYRVQLNNGIRVELTATTRVGMQRIVYPDSRQFMTIDLNHRDPLLQHRISVIDRQTLSLSRVSKAWATEQHVYAYVQFSAPFEYVLGAGDKQISLQFSLPTGEALLIKTGLSFTDVAGAQGNLAAELGHWDFDAVQQQARESWQKELSKIVVNDPDTTKLVNFYTAMYHLMIHPNVASDVDGRYRGGDLQIHQSETHTHYTVFSLWDTFRAAHPLLTLIDRQRTRDFIQTMLLFYQQSGRLPVWELAANETDCMIGYHSVSVIADAAVKGIHGFDLALALQAMQHSAQLNHLGLEAYQKQRQITADDEHESVSKQLEYAYDDWCIAQMAHLLGDTATERAFLQRSAYWQNLFDPASGFMRPKKNGGWLEPFDPREVNNHFTEGNSWQYSFFVPHAMPAFIEAHGGKAALAAKLDALFTAEEATTGRAQADITGLIGQYAHGNEPSHHMAFLYQNAGKPAQTQLLVDSILRNFYTNAPDGLIGNEDCGQMSAWFVLASLGLYQVSPGYPWFHHFAPHVQAADVTLENGRVLRIRSDATTAGAIYPKAFRYNAENKTSLRGLSYKELLEGPLLEFTLSKQAQEQLPVQAPSPPAYHTPGFLVNPLITATSQVFADSLLVHLSHVDRDVQLYYTLDGSAPTSSSQLYIQPLVVRRNSRLQVWARSSDGRRSSAVVSASYYKLPEGWQVQSLQPTHPQYSANGPTTLIDGLRGSTNWRQGNWLGYFGNDMEVVVDLGTLTQLSKVTMGFLQDSRAWIVFPKELSLYVSNDGKTYKKAGSVKHGESVSDETVRSIDLQIVLPKPQEVRYLRLIATNYGRLPKEHVSAGEPAYIFVDELLVTK